MRKCVATGILGFGLLAHTQTRQVQLRTVQRLWALTMQPMTA